MLLLLCCALNREYTMRQPLKHSCHKDLEKVSGSEKKSRKKQLVFWIIPLYIGAKNLKNILLGGRRKD
jgi:hypothetical protein